MTQLLEVWLSEVEMNLLSGDKDERNLLAADIDATTTTVTFTAGLEGVQAGAYVGLDLELVYVVDANEAGKQATVIRGQLGSARASHSANTTAYVNPRFSRWAILKALNAELRDLSAPPNMIFQVKSFTTTTQPTQRTYAVPAANTDILSFLEMRYSFPDQFKAWPRIQRGQFSMLRNMPTDQYPAGMAIRIDDRMYPGRDLRVVYAAPLGELSALTDDVLTTTGIPATAADIPPLGAAARLLGVREAKRSFTESATNSRRASEVPPSSAARAAAGMMAVLNQRIKSEASRLKTMYPETM